MNTFELQIGGSRWSSEVGKSLAALNRDRRSAHQHLVRAQAERKSVITDRIEHRRTVRRLEAEERELERRLKRLNARFKIRMRQDKPQPTWSRKRDFVMPPRTRTIVRNLKAYRKPFLDKNGREAVFMKASYLGLKSPNFRAGLAADHVRYILRLDALENAILGPAETFEEAAELWNVLEQVEQADRANAKLQFRLIVNLPHEIADVDRRKIIAEFCDENFARHGLPYVAAIHVPDVDGDERNYHAHIAFSNRPMARTAEGEWEIAPQKRTDLAGKEYFFQLRRSYADALNRTMQTLKLQRRYTHLSYRARGLHQTPQQHLGPALTAQVRAGHYVPAAARNEAIVDRNEAIADAEKAEANLEKLEAVRACLAALHAEGQETAAKIRAAAQLRRLLEAVSRNAAVKEKTADRQPVKTLREHLLRAKAVAARRTLSEPQIKSETVRDLRKLIAAARPVSQPAAQSSAATSNLRRIFSNALTLCSQLAPLPRARTTEPVKQILSRLIQMTSRRRERETQLEAMRKEADLYRRDLNDRIAALVKKRSAPSATEEKSQADADRGPSPFIARNGTLDAKRAVLAIAEKAGDTQLRGHHRAAKTGERPVTQGRSQALIAAKRIVGDVGRRVEEAVTSGGHDKIASSPRLPELEGRGANRSARAAQAEDLEQGVAPPGKSAPTVNPRSSAEHRTPPEQFALHKDIDEWFILRRNPRKERAAQEKAAQIMRSPEAAKAAETLVPYWRRLFDEDVQKGRKRRNPRAPAREHRASGGSTSLRQERDVAHAMRLPLTNKDAEPTAAGRGGRGRNSIPEPGSSQSSKNDARNRHAPPERERAAIVSQDRQLLAGGDRRADTKRPDVAATSAEARKPVNRGLDPKIDAWIKSHDDKNGERIRNRLAAAVLADASAAAKLPAMDPEIVRALRREAKRHRLLQKQRMNARDGFSR